MKTKLQNYAMALMLGMGLAGVSATAHAEEDISVFADIGIYSQYLWRGAAQSVNNDPSVQGDVGVEHSSGVSANIWFATGVDTGAAGDADTEYDITLDYSGEAGDFGYSVGYIRYDYVTNSGAASEVYLGGSYGIASATIYVGDGYQYLEAGAGDSVADMFDASATVGYNTDLKTTDISVSASKDFDMDFYTLTPSLTIGKADSADTEFALGVNASF